MSDVSTAAANSSIHSVPPRHSRSLLFSGAIFVVAFAASAGVAWSFFPKGAVPASSVERAHEREERLLDRVGQLEREVANKKVAEAETVPLVNSHFSPDEIFAKASPAVVKVVMQDAEERQISQASAFLVDERGLFATNYHAIKRGSQAYIVFANGARSQVLGVAAMNEKADLAIIKVIGQVEEKPLELATDDLPAVGAKVFAIGNPLGLTHTFSDGIVSARREPGEVAGEQRVTMIQITAPISPGSSGGPLLDSEGRVIGVTTATKRNGQNLNLAVPSLYVDRLLIRARNETALTTFPLTEDAPQERVVTFAGRPRPAYEWSPEDIENAKHFVRALKAADEAYAAGRRSGLVMPLNPWRLAANFKGEYLYHMRQAYQEGRLVRQDVLSRMNPKLPGAFRDFVAGVYAINYGVSTNQNADPGGLAAWEHWAAWSHYGMEQTHVPPGARD